ncbi:isocitrate/isopropylmalate dehydrogenase family protein [Shouchella rhizosphaerae]|uniref:isocitrate/isopropylmalate dehydrogenase family protein n=1 Tax=Shouchella rhizosphaerae TaxID=866786 RepID=UPI003F802CBE
MEQLELGVLYGDGIGYEIVSASVKIVSAAAAKSGLAIDWHVLPMGLDAIKQTGSSMPAETVQALDKLDGWLMGPHDSQSYPKQLQNVRNPSGELRHHFDLYANIRPAKSEPYVKGVVERADLVIYRENTEGFYVDRNMYKGIGEWMVTADVAVTAGVFTRKAIERIAHAAFRAARERRKKVSIVHKANVISLGSGLFLNVCKEVGHHYPDVSVDDYHIDAMCAHLVRRAAEFDVIVAENMFGDILSDLTGELVGSLGLAGSINASESKAMAQAAHGSAPDIAGLGLANPIGMIRSSAMLLGWSGKKHKSQLCSTVERRINQGVADTLASGVCTKDLGGTASTQQFTDVVCEKIEEAE